MMVIYNDLKGSVEDAQKRIGGRLTCKDLTEDVKFLDAYIFQLYNALNDNLKDKAIDPNLLHEAMGKVMEDRPFVESICQLIAANEHKAEHLKETDFRVKYNAIMRDNPLLNSMILCTLLQYNKLCEKESYRRDSRGPDINNLIDSDISYEKKEAIAELLQKWLDPEGSKPDYSLPQRQRCLIPIEEIRRCQVVGKR